jgi:hypothetical protein
MLALMLPTYRHELSCVRLRSKQENVNARTTQGNFGRRRRVEVWRRMYLDDTDLYYRVLVTRIRTLLALPTDYEFLRFLPDRKVGTDCAAMELLSLAEQHSGADHDRRDRIVRHCCAKFQLRLQPVLDSF